MFSTLTNVRNVRKGRKMQITNKIIELINSGVTKAVVERIAPVITVACDNAIKRHIAQSPVKQKAPLFAVAVFAAADSFLEKIPNFTNAPTDGDTVTLVMSVDGLVRLRILQNAVDEYRERLALDGE